MEATNVKASPEKTGLDIEKEKRKQKALDITKATGAYLFLTICAFFAFLPFYWMIISSLKTEDEYRLTTPTFFPKEFKWQNYSYGLCFSKN